MTTGEGKRERLLYIFSELNFNAWHDGISMNLNYCWMLEQHMDLWISLHTYRDLFRSLPVETLSFISYFHIVFRVKCSFFFLFRMFRNFYFFHMLLDKFKGLDGLVDGWVMRREKRNIAHWRFLFTFHFCLSEIAFFTSSHNQTNKNSFCSFLFISRRPGRKSEAICVNGLLNHFLVEGNLLNFSKQIKKLIIRKRKTSQEGKNKTLRNYR